LEERVSRNGHPPAALWIVGRQALAERIEREIFEKGWQVQMLSNAEFKTQELNPVVTMLQRMGMIAIVSLTADDPDFRKAITAIYGQESFLAADDLPTSDSEAGAQIMRSLDELQRRFTSQGRRQ
jgi:hypothetical protein